MEKIFLIGNLGADASVQDFNGKRFLSFRVGCSRKFQTNGQDTTVTTWYDCTYNNADTKVLPFLKSGQKVFVSGQPTYRIYDSAKYHTKMVGVSLFVNEIELCGGVQNQQQNQSQANQSQNNHDENDAAPF